MLVAPTERAKVDRSPKPIIPIFIAQKCADKDQQRRIDQRNTDVVVSQVSHVDLKRTGNLGGDWVL